MSQELYQMLHERSRIRIMRWPLGVALSVGMHGAVIAAMLIPSSGRKEEEPTKVTWVSLPALGNPGTAGGAAPMEAGTQGERQRRVEEVAPQSNDRPGSMTPNAFGDKKTPSVKGTNTDATSLGKSPVAAKGKNPTANPTPGAAGSGDGKGLGEGTAIPGLKAAMGVAGGSGLISDIDSQFPFLWYLAQTQNRITGNWARASSGQGRVQIYFKILRNGSLEGIRVEIPSGNATLDQSAEQAVKRSNPLPPLPEGFEGQSLGVRFWFTYLGN